MLLQPLGQDEGILHMAVETEREGLKPLKQQERIERTDRRSEITQPLHPGLNDKTDISVGTVKVENIPELHPVVPLRRFGKSGEFPVSPIVGPCIDNHSPNAGAMSANPLGRR